MEGILKEISKLEQLTQWDKPSKGKSPSISTSLDTLLTTLRAARAKLDTDPSSAGPSIVVLPKAVEDCRKEVDQRQKEVYNALAKIGKALDKVFTAPLPEMSEHAPLFAEKEDVKALEEAIAQHYMRTGHFEIARVLVEEAGLEVSEKEALYGQLYKILIALQKGDFSPAIEWATSNRSYLAAYSSSLEFDLHRAQYIHLLLTAPTAINALTYARTHLSPFQSTHSAEISRLLGALAYLPASKLRSSPYADLLADESRTTLSNTFAALWCASSSLPRAPPLRVAADLGPSALARIEKGKKVLRSRSQWAARDELPIEIPLPAENRYHSVFTCPVSKEQASERNPPMMIGCGHVICAESLEKLAKPHGHLKCPYCPVESRLDQAIRVHF